MKRLFPRGFHLICGLAFTLFLLSACKPLVDHDQPHINPSNSFDLLPGTTVGQTFVAQHSGLTGIEFALEPDPRLTTTLILHLRTSPLAVTDLLSTTVLISSSDEASLQRFTFPADFQTHAQYYYAYLESLGPGKITVATGNLDTYRDGVLYDEGVPQEQQTVFGLVYDPFLIVADLLLLVLRWGVYGVLISTILFLAGYGLVSRWAIAQEVDFTQTFVLSCAAILAAWMVFLVWGSVMGIRVNTLSVRALFGVLDILGAFLFFKYKPWKESVRYWQGESVALTVGLWGIVLAAVGLRLFMGRALVMLPGSDAYHHTLIAQLFAEQGGIPQTYEPYAPLSTFSYHFGFHSIVALIRWLLGSSLLETTKNTALVLNGLIALTTALLAETITGNRRAGVVAAAVVGLIAVSPVALLRWGRFTQTAGMLFLPLALMSSLLVEKSRARLLPILFVAGVALTHFRLFSFWLCWIAVWCVSSIVAGRSKEVLEWMRVGIMAFILTAPWLLRVLWVNYDPQGMRLTYPVLGNYNRLDRLEQEVLDFKTNGFVLGAGLLLSFAVFRLRERRYYVGVLLIWSSLLLAGAVGAPLLIGNYFWELTTILLTLVIPIAIIIGVGGAACWDWLCRNKLVGLQAALVGVFLIGMGIGIRSALPIIYSGTRYLRTGDLEAMSWIREHTPQDAYFAVDGFSFSWSPGWIVGIDAGYWVPLLTMRQAVPPLMIYSMEWRNSPTALSEIGASQAILELTATGQWDTLPEILRQYRVNYVLLDSRYSALPPRILEQVSGLQVVYRQDTIWVFEAQGSS